MPLTIPIAHDFICPWCWVGFLQTQRLKAECGVRFEWRGYELFPDELEWPSPGRVEPPPANKPPTLSRFELLLAAEGIVMPAASRPHHMRTHNAHEAVEYAKSEGAADSVIEILYRAYWEEGKDINDPEVLLQLLGSQLQHPNALREAIAQRRFKDNIVGFDEPAYRSGVYNVPTFFIGGKRYAEQPTTALLRAIQEAQEEGGWIDIYANLSFPELHEDRPYTVIDMVATIDGKTVSGSRHDSASDLGSSIDHKLMRRLENATGAVMVGAATLRATSPAWNPRAAKRYVVSKSGDLPEHAGFWDGDAYVATSGSAMIHAPSGAKLLRAGGQEVDFRLLMHRLKASGVNKLLVLGGSELNAQLMRLDLVDELFLTIAPKVKLGSDLPTYAGGEALARDRMQSFKLVEHHAVGDEMFLRYRRERKK